MKIRQNCNGETRSKKKQNEEKIWSKVKQRMSRRRKKSQDPSPEM